MVANYLKLLFLKNESWLALMPNRIYFDTTMCDKTELDALDLLLMGQVLFFPGFVTSLEGPIFNKWQVWVKTKFMERSPGLSGCSVQFSSVAQSYPTLWNPMNRSTSGLPVHYQLLEFTQTDIHQVSDGIPPSHLLLSPSPPAPNLSQHQSLFQRVNSSHEVAKVLEFQL